MVENPVAHFVGDPLIPAAELGKDGAYAKPLGDWWNHVEATKVWSQVHGWRIILSMVWFLKDNFQETIVFTGFPCCFSGVEWCCMGLLKNIVTFCWLGFPTIGNDTKKSPATTPLKESSGAHKPSQACFDWSVPFSNLM